MNFRSSLRIIEDKLTRLLRLDVRFYTRAANLFAWSQVSLVLRGLVTTYAMAILLPREIFGEFRYILALSGFASILSMGGMGSGVVRAVAQGDTGVVHRVFRSMCIYAPLGSLLLVIFGAYSWIKGDHLLALSILCAAIAFVPQSLGMIYPQILTGQVRLKRLAIITTISNVGFALLFAGSLFISRNLLWLCAAYFFLDALWKFIPTMIEMSRLPKSREIKDKENLKLSRHMNAITMLQSVAFQIDEILIQHFAGFQALAAFSVAIAIPDQLRGLIGQFSNTFLQRLSRSETTKKGEAAIQRHYWTGLLISSGITALYVIGAPVFFHVFLPKYADQIFPSIIYGLSIIPIISTLIGSNYAQASTNVKKLWSIYSWNAAIQFVSDIVLIPIFGAWGAIGAKMISRFAGLPFCYPRRKKEAARESAA